MRMCVILAALAVFGVYMTASVIGWWTQPIAAFSGRREFWWDAEDFTVFYAAGTLVAAGELGSLYDSSAHAAIQMPLLVGHDEPLGFYNPAFFALLFVPFSWLSAEDGFRAWTLVNFGLIVVMCGLLWRIAQPLSPWYRAAIVVGFVTMYPLPFGVRLGQFSLILAVSWAAAYLLLRANRERAAGFALSPLLIKPELLIPVTALIAWKRRWLVLKTLLPVSAIAIAVSVAMIGPVGAWDYTLHIADAAGEGSGNMYGWNGFLAPLLAEGDPGAMTPIAAPLAVLSLAAVAYVWMGELRTDGGLFPVQWLALSLATMLWDAHFYLQDTIILAAPAVAVVASASEWRRTVAGVGVFLGWVILGYGSTPSAEWGFNLFSGYAAAWLVAITCWQAGARIRAQREATEDEEPVRVLTLEKAA